MKTPRLHILSDLHLETGPYEIPADLEYDILIAAGDIGPPALSVPWLIATGKPVVYIMGNHEHWETDLGEALAEAKRLAAGTQVHVLEREDVVVQGLRFLGCTYWSDIGRGNRWLRGKAKTRDYQRIRIAAWLAKNESRVRKLLSRAGGYQPGDEKCERAYASIARSGLFVHETSMLEHADAVRWLGRKLMSSFDGPTVVVTHHSPTYESLRRFKSARELDYLDPRHFKPRSKIFGRVSDRDTATRIGCYASEDSRLLRRHADRIALWVHGHLHEGMDFVAQGVRVICNPRGYCEMPPDERCALLRVFGYDSLASEQMVAQDRVDFAQNPYRGDAFEFQRRLVVGLVRRDHA
ncbi:hypothetical protein AzCIB_1403 [Azoarcus sp. CIB]|uniref:metallophosphoesterase n=1 Tax=Aromatoleum sp. (strain CIB) TaxID=198107 RepID=UPI00067AAD02|nr:metallophosphoesterase [Azoarcus sp. CIB]AKU11305.1 hypothetical protein AzCIB_1403 [Azoarcus sp. CIB]